MQHWLCVPFPVWGKLFLSQGELFKIPFGTFSPQWRSMYYLLSTARANTVNKNTIFLAFILLFYDRIFFSRATSIFFSLRAVLASSCKIPFFTHLLVQICWQIDTQHKCFRYANLFSACHNILTCCLSKEFCWKKKYSHVSYAFIIMNNQFGG